MACLAMAKWQILEQHRVSPAVMARSNFTAAHSTWPGPDHKQAMYPQFPTLSPVLIQRPLPSWSQGQINTTPPEPKTITHMSFT